MSVWERRGEHKIENGSSCVCESPFEGEWLNALFNQCVKCSWWSWKWLRAPEAMIKGSFPHWQTSASWPPGPPNTHTPPATYDQWKHHYGLAFIVWLTALLIHSRLAVIPLPETQMNNGQRDRDKVWHRWHCGRWFRETNTCLASVNVTTMMRWWGNPSVFPCLCVCSVIQCVLCQCRQWVGTFTMFMCGYCVWTERSLYSRHVVYPARSDSLLPASVVYLCSLWKGWLTPHSWPTRNWPDLTGSDHTSRNTSETAVPEQ